MIEIKLDGKELFGLAMEYYVARKDSEAEAYFKRAVGLNPELKPDVTALLEDMGVFV